MRRLSRHSLPPACDTIEYRRHLTESQRAMVAARLADMTVGEAGNGRSTANLQSNSAVEAGTMLNVSERSLSTAKKVRRDGSKCKFAE